MCPLDIPALCSRTYPSRSVFIHSDRYVSDDSLGYWVAHELGHLAANSASENAADKAHVNIESALRMHPNQTYISVYRRFGRVQSGIVVG